MPRKLTYQEVKSYIESIDGHILISKQYKNNRTKLEIQCQNNHIFYITYDSFKRGHRCAECAGLKPHDLDYIKDFALKDGTKCKSDKYINSNNYLIFECPNGHEYKMVWYAFQRGHRCKKCFFENKDNLGENHHNYNPNRNEVHLNRRLRKTRSQIWIKNNLRDDPNYENYINNPDDYRLDHIIPVKLFCELFTRYNLDESEVKQIINEKNNLQLLTKEENYSKSFKGSSLFEAAHYLINNGIYFENFLEEKLDIP